MNYANELLTLAAHLAKARTKGVGQACFRRAISTAYYALFHLLVSEASGNWRQEIDRPLLGRLFGHGKMKAACFAIPGADPKSTRQIPPFDQRTPEDHLRAVARIFLEAQFERETADYDLSRDVTMVDAGDQIERVADAFKSWDAIRGGPDAQRFLLDLLGPRQEKR